MKISIISFTEKGRNLSLVLKKILTDSDIQRHCFYTHCDNESTAFESLNHITESLFQNSDALIFVCACGIAVRAISPYIKEKTTDPAVIVIDDCGKFVIPVLSGHLGGANRLSEIIAEKIHAVPVITTATDTGKKFSPDSFAKANNLIISDMNTAKKIAVSILDNETIGLYCEYNFVNLPKELTVTKSGEIGIVISPDSNLKIFNTNLNLVPKNLVLGIGCKRGTSCETIENNVFNWLKTEKINPDRIKSVATIDLKKNEKGLADFCKKMSWELNFYTAEQLMNVSGDFAKSDFVKSVTGVDNVCERSAVIQSEGKLIMHKHGSEGVTCAVAEIPIVIDFERKIL